MADFVTTVWSPDLDGLLPDSPSGTLFFVSGGGGSPPSPFGVVGAAQYALNSVDVGFNLEPRAERDGAPGDALTASAYTLLGAGVQLPRVTWVERVGPGVIRVYTDAALDPEAEYEIEVVGVLSLDGYPISVSADSALFPTFRKGLPAPSQPIGGEVRTDLANLPGQGALNGALAYDETGDLANESGVAYLRKRILRRLTTARGGFFHLPDYGVGLTAEVKRLVTPDLVRRMRSRIAAQVRAEPGVLEAKVSITRPTPVTLDVRISVRDDSGALIPEIRATVDLDTEE